MKQKLVVVGRQPRLMSWANSEHIRIVLGEYFSFEDYNETVQYSPNTWFVILAECYLEVKDKFKDRQVIIDVCCEANMNSWDKVLREKISHHIVMYGNVPNDARPDMIFVPNFFWYYEALLQPKTFVPNFNYSKKFLMPVGRKTKWRDHIVEVLDPWLEDAYWSYVRRGRALPGEPDSVPGAKRWNTRYDNPAWYNDTCFSLVLESITSWEGCVPFLTEKIYKPIKNCHPFMVLGAPGILKHLESQGFVTFENLFDQSYELESDLDKKLKIVIDNIERCSKLPFDQDTLNKVLHNQQLFYDRQVILQDMKKSIVDPILEIIS